MLVVADASPLNILIRLGYAPILPAIFTRVLIPTRVAQELQAPNTPEVIKHFMKQPPSWLEILSVDSVTEFLGLDAGECAAITLAQHVHAELLLIDEAAGRKQAKALGIAVIGALGVLELASRLKLVELTTAISQLQKTDFRLADDLVDEVLGRNKTATR